MASNPKNFLDRNGRYFSRISVPEHLRPFLNGKTELRKALGGDRRSAVAQHMIEVAVFRMMLDDAERLHQEAAAANATPIAPWSTQEIAFDNYSRRLAFDMECRRTDHHYANAGFDDQLVSLLKRGYSGLLSDGELAVLVVDRINHYKRLGHTTATFGTFEWRTLAMEICRSEYEAIARATERDEGDFSGHPGVDTNLKQPVPTAPDDVRMHVAPLAPTTPVKSQSIQTLFDQYIASRKVLGGGAGVEKRWPPVIKDLIDFLEHEDALRIQKSDIIRWRNEKQKTLAPKTIKSVYLSCIQTVLKWAVENDLLPTNEAATVRQELPKTYQTREKGYRKAEALRILKATQESQSPGDATKDTAARLASIRWVPWLCAFTGARVVEITQLRRQDIRWEENAMILRISPDAGTVKTGQYRDVPVHPQIMEMGFAAFVEAQEGPLFYTAKLSQNPLKSAQASAVKLTKWLHCNQLTVADVAPNHGWRHHFKTYAREAKIEDRVLDAITGHASRTAGDDYGDVTLLTKINAINSLPHYDLAIPL